MTRSKYKEQQTETHTKKRPLEEQNIQPQTQLVKRQRIDNPKCEVKRSQMLLEQRTGRRRTQKKSLLICLLPSLRKFELMWAHVKGYSLWPGIIEEETKKGRYRIHFFGDYTRCDVTKSKIIHMMEGFNKFSSIDIRNPLLNKAISEAKFFVFNDKSKSCPICDILLMKTALNKPKAIEISN